MRKRWILGTVIVVYGACLVLAAWKYTHPERNLNSVINSRWNGYSKEYSLGYIRGWKRAKSDLWVIAAAKKTSTFGALPHTDSSKDIERSSLIGLEAEAKSVDELKGSRDGYHDLMEHIWENLK